MVSKGRTPVGAVRRLWELEIARSGADTEALEFVLYVYKIDIHLNPKVGRDHCLPRQRWVIVTHGNNQKHYLDGALPVRTGRPTSVEGKSKDSAFYIRLLWRLANKDRRARRIHLILDNASVHFSKKTRLALAQLGRRFVPPYCP